MKRILSILFLLIFLFNLAGYFIVFKIMQYSVREEMMTIIKKNIPDKDLERIVVSVNEMTSSSEFKFGEENEFLYNGKLYDVVRQKTDGVKIIFYCINDTNEEKLIVELNRYANLNSNQNIPVKQKTNLLINNIIKEALPENSKSFFSNTADFNIHFIYKSLLTKQYIPILCPPPKA